MNMYINETWNNHLILTFNYGKTFLGKGGRNAVSYTHLRAHET